MKLGGRATSCNRSPVRNAVATGLAQCRNAKDRKKPVRISPVRFFSLFGNLPEPVRVRLPSWDAKKPDRTGLSNTNQVQRNICLLHQLLLCQLCHSISLQTRCLHQPHPSFLHLPSSYGHSMHRWCGLLHSVCICSSFYRSWTFLL